ncbi:hypothetical protein IP69_14715 [Bosea sp. AAP35]|uniref:sugar phosphate isomerase/epimerase family protein n=1 Tax=Bosea sp. AAP35 TaxID=1523417 RepID=UPI0006B8A10C|nr:sugar phosphate isomerase/epimerase family protein [Bosea sp. AAP35]KPF66557.1 hypothetical protein IP69_14715 [Bosea sp. AAP35]
MYSSGVRGVGITAGQPASDLSDLPAILDRVERLEVDTVELSTCAMDLIFGGRIHRPHLDLLKRACAGRPFGYSVHGPLAINFFDEPTRLQRHFDVLRASLEIAAELGAVHYVMHSGVMPLAPAEVVEAAYLRQREWLRKAGDAARDGGILLCVETMFDYHPGRLYASLPSRLASEMAAIDHDHVWATLDFSHAFLRLGSIGGDYLEEIAALAPLAKHLHMHDSFGRPDAFETVFPSEKFAFGHGDIHLPVGWGGIPWEALMERCTFPEGVLLNIELNPRLWYAVDDAMAATRALAGKVRTAPRKQT